MLFKRQGSETYLPTFPLIASCVTAPGAIVLLVFGAPGAFALISLGLAVVYVALAAVGMVEVRRADDTLFVRKGFQRFEVPVAGTAFDRALLPHSRSQGARSVVVLVRPGQPPITLATVGGFTPGGALRSAQAIGNRMATRLGIPHARELSEREDQVVRESNRSVRFVVIALIVLFGGLVAIYGMGELGPHY